MSIPRPTSAVNGGGFARSAGAAAGRGVLLVVFALAVGVLLLARALDDDGGTNVEAGVGTETTLPADTATTAPAAETTAPPATAPPVTHPPAQVKVLVLNGRAIQGIAGSNNEVLLTQNFNALPPDNTPSPVPATRVTYVDPAYQPDAASVAAILGIPPEAVVQADSGTELGMDTKGANVVVVLGTDNVGAVT